MKTIQDFDRELAAMQHQYQQLWGRIEQCKMERAFELNRLAREVVRAAPASTCQRAQWNNHGHRNDNFADREEMFQ